MVYFSCPYLKNDVELTNERELHITDQHPDLLPNHRQYISNTLVDPDQIRRSLRFGNARMFSRWFESLRDGKYVVVVVVSDSSERHWIITAYMTGKLAKGGNIEWEKV